MDSRFRGNDKYFPVIPAQAGIHRASTPGVDRRWQTLVSLAAGYGIAGGLGFGA